MSRGRRHVEQDKNHELPAHAVANLGPLRDDHASSTRPARNVLHTSRLEPAQAPQGMGRLAVTNAWGLQSRRMPCSYYIYYRVDPAKAAVCEPQIRELLAAVHAATGIRGRIMKKRGEPNLWMEVYENVSDGAKFEWELAEAAGRLKVQEFLLPGTPRYMECFEDA